MSQAEVKRPFTPFLREGVKRVLSPLFRSEVITGEEGGIEKFEGLLLEGYGGIILLKHFSLKDPPQIVADTVIASKVMVRREVLTPTARHQVYPFVQRFASILEIKIDPIVTDNTIKRAKEKGKTPPQPNEGLKEFTSDATDLLRRGGILYIAPEGERRSNLEEYPNRTIGTLLATLKRVGATNVAFLFVDLRLAGRKNDYWNKKWFNLLNKYEVRIGRTLTFDQVMEMAGGKFGNVDNHVIFPEMMRTAAIPMPNRG